MELGLSGKSLQRWRVKAVSGTDVRVGVFLVREGAGVEGVLLMFRSGEWESLSFSSSNSS